MQPGEEAKQANEVLPIRSDSEEESIQLSRELLDSVIHGINTNVAEKLDQIQNENYLRFEDLHKRQDELMKIFQEQIKGLMEQIQPSVGQKQVTLQQPTATNPPQVNEIPALEINLSEPNIRRPNRKDSAFNRLSNFRAGQREGLLTIESDKHTEINWKIKTVDGFLQFIEHIDRFVLTYNQPITYLFTHIAPDLQEVIAELLYVHKPQRYNSRNDVYKANIQDIYEMVQIHFAPRDLGHFNKLLLTSCKKYEVMQRGENYAPIKLKLYGLRQRFKERFDFLSEGALRMLTRDAIPAINYKVRGLLNIWTELTREGSKEPLKQMLINRRYDSLEEFLEKYFAKVDETNTLSENIKVYRFRTGWDQRKSYTTVNMLEEDEETYIQGVIDEQDEVFAVEDSRDKDRQPRREEICPKLLVQDKCWDRNCRFSHNPRLMSEERKKLASKWSTISNPTPQSVKPWKSTTNPSRDLSQVQISRPTDMSKNYSKDESKSNKSIRPGLNFLEEEQEESEKPDEAELSDVEDCNLISAFLQLTTSRNYYAATHREATVNIPGSDKETNILVALFDSGASSDNYISESCIERNNFSDNLQQCNKKVKVANGMITTIQKKIRLAVIFVDNNNQHVTAELDFYVLQGLSLELVIGLPSILCHFKSLFLEMIQAADGDCLFLDQAILEGDNIQLDWKENLICEEEIMIPQPASFHFLECSREEAIQNFLESLPSRIDPEFSRETAILDFLRREAVDVFVPLSWEGIRGVEPVSLQFDEKMPRRIKPAARKIPAAIFAASKKEFQRMCSYFYRPSTSPISSPMVVAPKTSDPFVRICGDYRIVNKFVICFHFPIPDVTKELHKAAQYIVYVDLDMKNAFHAIIIDAATSRILSIQTPWGQFEPMFLPEGVAPASAILMAIVSEVFSEFCEWMIVIFDNILILASDHEDAFRKTVLVINRCRERNIVLKLSKSSFGRRQVEFFGYQYEGGSYRLSEDRIKSVTSSPFPERTNKVKKIQHFRYVKWANSTRKKIDLICKLFNQRFEWSATDVDAYGRHHELRNDMILVDGDLCAKYPKILEA